MENRQNISIAGSGSVGGGIYENVTIAGNGRIDGDLTCTSLSIAGSGSVKGNVTADTCRVAGSGHIHGSLAVREVRFSGSGQVEGDLLSSGSVKFSGSGKVAGNLVGEDEVRFSGSGKVGGSLKANKVFLSGSVTVEKGIECESMNVGGSFTVRGLINAGTLEVRLGGACEAEEIGGESVRVLRSTETNLNIFGFSLRLGGAGIHKLTTNLIEASDITLENTTAETVRGERVVIGPGCDIKTVEYSQSLSVSPEARVENQVKVE